MARIVVNADLVQGAMLLGMTSAIQNVRALLKRRNDIMDFTRSGSDFTALGVALGCSTADAATLYSRFKAIQTAMDGTDFVNLSDVDQG